MTDDKKNPFHDGELIFAYSREEALEDGALIDVTSMAKEVGFRYPVALTRALWSDIESIPPGRAFQDVNGRLRDVLWMGYLAVRNSKKASDTLTYELVMPVAHRKSYSVKLVCGPGDTAEPVITMMCPDED